jgi:hypothetical protein
MTWTNQEMKTYLEGLGYDLTNDQGEYSELIMVDIAANVEKFKWDEEREVWFR